MYQIPPEDTERAVRNALDVGYRHIDTAAAYRNETAVRRAIEASGIARDELFITTKMWIVDGCEAGATQAFDTTLRQLDLDYLDLYLVHQPLGDHYSSWRAMETLLEQQRVRAIGVSNFQSDRLVDLIDHTSPQRSTRSRPTLSSNATQTSN